MGLIRTAIHSAKGVMADQWKEYFYCDAMEENVLALKGQKRVSGRASNEGSDNIISSGSVVAVADGQCMMIVEQGKIVEFCAEPGEFVFDASTEPTIFSGDLGQGIMESLKTMGKRFTFGGEAAKDQRVYYFNTKELVGNKYGTPNPVPFRVVDERAGIDIDISIRCFGEYSYRISDPILFYTNVCGNVADVYTRAQIDGQLKTELLTALQPAFAKISDMGIRYSALPGHTMELADALNEVLSAKWRDLRGLEIVSVGVSSVKASEEDEAMIKEMQKTAAFRDQTMAAAHLVGAQAAAMQSAAKNENAGPAMAFMGMNMANQMGGASPQNLFQMGQQQQMQQAQMAQQNAYQQGGTGQGYAQAPQGNPNYAQNGQTQASAQSAQRSAQGTNGMSADSWQCSCGAVVTGNFCTECGAKKPEPKPAADTWTCPNCGKIGLTGKFCPECGTRKPVVAQYKCDKCGWVPEDPTHPPKFCPNCGDPFNDGDIVG